MCQRYSILDSLHTLALVLSRSDLAIRVGHILVSLRLSNPWECVIYDCNDSSSTTRDK